MKKVIALLLSLIVLLSLAACAGNQQPQQQQQGADKKVVIRLGTATAPDGHYVKGAQQFKDKVEQYSNKKVEVQIFPNSQLGNERDLIEGVGLGTVEMCVSSTGPLPNFSPDFQVFDLPFIITDRQKAYAVMDGDIGQKILGDLDKKGIKALGFWENGFRHISNNKKVIAKPEDVKGLKIRTMENPIHMETFKYLGAIPTPMAWSEVFTALQQGVIDAQENPLVIVDTSKLYEVQKYLSLTGHFYSPAVAMISKKVFESYPKDVQDAILKAEKEARDWERNYSTELDKTLGETLKGKGMTITQVDKTEWQKASQPVYDKFKDKIKPEYINALLGK